MKDESRDFYNNMNDMFASILKENEQVLFITKSDDPTPIEMDYSRVFFNCMFDIFKKDAKTRSLIKIDSEKFKVVDSEGKEPVVFHVQEYGVKANLTEKQYERILVDPCMNIYKIDHQANKAVPADSGKKFKAVIV